MNFPGLGFLTPYLAGGILIVGAFAGVQTWRVNNLKHDVDVANGRAEAWKGVAGDIQGLRKEEAKAASTSYEGLQTTCREGIGAAVSKGRIIERIIHTPAAAGDDSGLYGAVELRRIIGQTPEAGSQEGGQGRVSR